MKKFNCRSLKMSNSFKYYSKDFHGSISAISYYGHVFVHINILVLELRSADTRYSRDVITILMKLINHEYETQLSQSCLLINMESSRV